MNRTKISLLIFLMSTSFFGWAQNENCVPDQVYFVKASSGMKMRKGPSVNTPVVTYVPHGMAILVCQDLFDVATFEGNPGNWRKVRFEDHYGYMFDGFLRSGEGLPADSITPRFIPESNITFKNAVLKAAGLEITNPNKGSEVVSNEPKDRGQSMERPSKPRVFQFVTETYNYCGPIEDIDPGLLWFGLYQKGDQYHFEPVELQVLKSKYNVGSGLEFDIRTLSETPSVFLVGMDRKPDSMGTVIIEDDYFVRHPRKLYPGQKLEIFSRRDIINRNNFILSAVGSVTDVGFCPVMKGYKIRVTGEMMGRFIIQDITGDIGPMGKCGMPEVYWFGDVNQDGFPDLVLVANHDEFSMFTFFLSDTRDPKALLRKAGQWRVGKCN